MRIQTLSTLTEAELNNPREIKRRDRMDQHIKKRYGDVRNVPDNWVGQRRRPGESVQHEDANSEFVSNEPHEDSEGT